MNLREKQLKLLQISKLRVIINRELERGLITEEDISLLMIANSNFGLKIKDKKYSYKQRVLMDIFNSPFILCDQDNLSLLIKRHLPTFLKRRYNMEKREISYLYDNGYLSKEEYIKEQEILKYCYYESSNDGINILETGEVVGIDNQVMKIK